MAYLFPVDPIGTDQPINRQTISRVETMTRFLEEVAQCPAALRELLDFYQGEGAALLDQWRHRLEQCRTLIFCGMGTSEIAPLTVQTELTRSSRAVLVFDAGEYLHYLAGKAPLAETLFVLISQSGESIETRRLAERLAGQAPLVVLANDERSTMARLADLFLPLRAGAEASISNKTYLNTLALLYLMAGGLAGRLREVADYLAQPAPEERIIAAAELLQPAESLHFIARGPALASARQLALTFMEGARAKAAAFTGGAFRHGPYEVLGEGHRAVVLAPLGKTTALLLAMAAEMAARGSRVALLTQAAEPPEHPNLRVVPIPDFRDERLFPLALCQTQNLLLHHVARLRGFEAGKFEVVSKVTTTE